MEDVTEANTQSSEKITQNPVDVKPEVDASGPEELIRRNALIQVIRQGISETAQPARPGAAAELRNTVRRSNAIVKLIQNFAGSKGHVEFATEALLGLGVISDPADKPILVDYLKTQDIKFEQNRNHPSRPYEAEVAKLIGSRMMVMSGIIKDEILDFHGSITTSDQLATVSSFLASLVAPEDLEAQLWPAETDPSLEDASGM